MFNKDSTKLTTTRRMTSPNLQMFVSEMVIDLFIYFGLVDDNLGTHFVIYGILIST